MNTTANPQNAEAGSKAGSDPMAVFERHAGEILNEPEETPKTKTQTKQTESPAASDDNSSDEIPDDGDDDNIDDGDVDVDDEDVNEDEADADDDEDDSDENDDADEQNDDDEIDVAKMGNKQVTIKVNGEDVKIPLSEALAGYSRESDYRQKTAEVNQKAEQIEKSRVEYAKRLEVLQYLPENIPAVNNEAELNKLLAEGKNDEYMAEKAKIDRAKQIWGERQRVEAETKAKRQEDFNTEIANCRATLAKRMPEILSDEGAQKLVSSLIERNFTQEEIDEVTNPEMFIIAEEARRYREIMAKRKATKAKKLKGKPKVQKRSKQQSLPKNAADRRGKNWQRLANSGSDKAAANVFVDLLTDDDVS